MATSNNIATRVGFLRSDSASINAAQNANDLAQSAPTDPWIGSTVGKYVIDSVIASGGMGTVYKAKQTFPVQRSVALKMIRIGLANAPIIERFHRERQTLALMDHPDIARVYEADSTTNGNPYFVMEYCDGLPIDEFCRENNLGLQARIELIVRIARALSRAHAHGVVHRDLKPGNILVSRCEGRPNMKVIDFGIAKVDEDRLGAEFIAKEATCSGEMIGTPAYMSPEQAAGGKIDCRTDVFAIGAILYKLLIDTTPIAWSENEDPSLAEIISAIQSFDPIPPSVKFANMDSAQKLQWCGRVGLSRPNQWTRILKGDLDWIVLRAIAPNRVDRYATADDFADDLERYLRNETVVAVAPSLSYRCRKFYQRRKALVLATAAVCVTLGLSGSFFGYQWVSSLQRRQAEVSSTSTQVELLLQGAESDRARASIDSQGSESYFAKAQTAVAKAESMLERFPELADLRKQQRLAYSRIELDRQAYRMAESLRNARENGVEQNEEVAGDAFGRQAVRDAILTAFSSVGIAVAETDPSHAAKKILQLPKSARETVVESLDLLMTDNPVGAGVFLSQSGGKLTVADMVYGGGSASRGQIRIGDRLIGIDTVLLDSIPSNEKGIEAYRLLASKPGSKISIRFSRGHSDERECDVICGGAESLWAHDVLSKIDPDPWRSELRSAIVRCDLAAMRNLARSNVEEQNASGAILLANALVLFERSNDAVRYMESVQQRYPGNFWLHQLLGNAFVTSYAPPRPEASVRHLTAAIALRPHSAGAHWSMARSLEMLGDVMNAREQKKRASELLSSHRSVPPTFIRKKSTDEVQKPGSSNTATKVVLKPMEQECLDLVRNDKRADAMKLIAERKANGLDEDICRRATGIVLAESRDYVGAKVIFTQVVRRNPEDVISRLYFAEALHQMGDDSLAIEQCEAALRSDPDFSPATELLNVLMVR